MRENLKIAKEYLSQVYRASREIDYLAQELFRLEQLMTTLRAVNYSERVQSSPSYDLVDTIEKIDGTRNCLEARISDYIRLVEDVKGTIAKCDSGDIYEVLWGRYILFQKWEDIADELGYCLRHVYRIHRKGLEEISKILQTCH